MNPRKAIVFFSAGLGDALLLVPAIKKLKQDGYHVSGLFNSPMPCREMMDHTGLLDEAIDAHGTFSQLMLLLKKAGHYELAVLNHFACTRRNLILAGVLAKKTITNRHSKSRLASWVNRKIHFVEPERQVHDAVQNLKLVGHAPFSLRDLMLGAPGQAPFELPRNYIALQVSSGNPQIAYKNWPLENWEHFFRDVRLKHPEQVFVLLGNEHDLPAAAALKTVLGTSLVSLAGKTTLTQAMQVLANCRFFLGLDGGLMHLAAAYQKPTFTLWGPSSEVLYGYEQFDATRHRCVRAATGCSPCNAWIEPNQSRFTAPEDCPDRACMQQLTVREVCEHYFKFVHSLPQDVR